MSGWLEPTLNRVQNKRWEAAGACPPLSTDPDMSAGVWTLHHLQLQHLQQQKQVSEKQMQHFPISSHSQLSHGRHIIRPSHIAITLRRTHTPALLQPCTTLTKPLIVIAMRVKMMIVGKIERGTSSLQRLTAGAKKTGLFLIWRMKAFTFPEAVRSSPDVEGALTRMPQDQCERLTVTSMEDLRSKQSSSHSSSLEEDNKLGCVSGTSILNHFLSAGFYLPLSGQQSLAEEHRGRDPTSCDAPHTSGLSMLTQHSRERQSCGIPEFSGDIFKTTCELEKENAHFIVVDMVLEVLEGAKWTLSIDQWRSAMDTHQHTYYKMCTHRHKQRCKACRHTQCCNTMDAKQEDNKSRHSDGDNEMSHRNTHSSKTYVHTQQHNQDEDAGNNEHQLKTFSVLSTDTEFEDYGVNTTLIQKDSLRNAERLAKQLVLVFRKSWLPSHRPQCGQLSLRSSLQELLGTGGMAVSSGSLTEEIRLRTRMRGSLCWTPPCFQIIFTVQPTYRRSEIVALQHFLCAGCGTEVEPRYIKKLRYCEYLGRYFCDCCHSGSEAVIPGRVLSCWDFGRYPVSDFSKQLLDSVWHQPLFDLTCVGKTLYSRVKELDKFRALQDQLLGIKKLLKACRLSGRLMTEFEQLPCHLTEQQHLFSMDDLFRVKKGQILVQARAVLHSAIDHVENCELCLARGFICEFCRERHIIFPFQSDICKRCPVCKACFHKQCFVEKKCPRCARIQSRKETF
ncbi:hypothetical protein PAMP_003326 [Pampus punctatissimus]